MEYSMRCIEMVHKKTEKRKQVRKTFEDTRNEVYDIISMCDRKIKSGKGLAVDEDKYFFMTLTEAFRSRITHPLEYTTSTGAVLKFGRILRFYEIFRNQNGNTYLYVTDESTGLEYKIPYVDLWKRLQEYAFDLAGFALEESLHMSAETPTKETSEGYVIG